MANNYLQFSAEIDNLSTAERDWLRRQLETVSVFGEREYPEGQVPAELSSSDLTWHGCRALRDDPEASDDGEAKFQYEFRDGNEPSLWLYAEEGGDPDQVAHLVRKFLSEFRPHEAWSLTYAATCSKMRVGQFSGGGCFVSAAGIEWFDSASFVSERRAAFASRSTATADRSTSADEAAPSQPNAPGSS